LKKKISGRAGEQAAAEWLVRRGYRILTRNFSVRGGELDIVALKRKTLCIIEVKSRASLSYGTPAEAVTAEKRSRIITAANEFLFRNDKGGYIRTQGLFGERKRYFNRISYDIAEVYMTPDEKVKKINLIRSAFS